MQTLLLLYVVTGVLLIALSVPLVQRRIKPNMWYGVRLRKTMQNLSIWYDVNAHAGRGMIVTGAATVVAAVVLALIPNIDIDVYSIGVLVVLMITLSGALILSLRYMNTL